MATLSERIRSGWNAFKNKDPSGDNFKYRPDVSTNRPDRLRMSCGNERTIVTAIYNRIALDVASVSIQHARLDQNDHFIEEIKSGLNNCLQYDANVDQTGRAFIQDIVMSMFDDGCVAIVPTDTTENPIERDSYDILSMRVGCIKQWYPKEVKIKLYNERKGKKEEIILPKKMVAIVENPLYAIMNEQNSTLKRLIHKLVLLDAIDEQNGAGKLDLIIQLPYAIKTEARQKQAENRRKDIEMQLSNSRYGIAYTDGTEHITQLNRSVDNQLLTQIEYLTNLLYSQLGLTAEIMNGTASEEAMLNYNNRTIEPILAAICDEMRRKFLTKTARTQGQSIVYIRDPFKLVPIGNIADIADKFTRNEILSSNEIRGIIGFKPSTEPRADELSNKNMPQEYDQPVAGNVAAQSDPIDEESYSKMMGDLNGLDAQLDDLEKAVK